MFALNSGVGLGLGLGLGGFVLSKRSIICLLCASCCSLLCFATFSRHPEHKIRTLCIRVRFLTLPLRFQPPPMPFRLTVLPYGSSRGSQDPVVLGPLPGSVVNGSYFVIIYVALGVVADASALTLPSATSPSRRSSAPPQPWLLWHWHYRHRHRSQDTFHFF